MKIRVFNYKRLSQPNFIEYLIKLKILKLHMLWCFSLIYKAFSKPRTTVIHFNFMTHNTLFSIIGWIICLCKTIEYSLSNFSSFIVCIIFIKALTKLNIDTLLVNVVMKPLVANEQFGLVLYSHGDYASRKKMAKSWLLEKK